MDDICVFADSKISIHATREGGDSIHAVVTVGNGYFNPRHP